MSMMQEFKEFAIKGNVVDLAVGVIIGGAFGKIVSTLTDKVIMPPIGLLLGHVKFADLKVVLQHEDKAAGLKEVALGYGEFIQVVLDFFLLAFIIFLMVKAINRLRNAAPPPPPEPTTQEKLLAEIRDALKAR